MPPNNKSSDSIDDDAELNALEELLLAADNKEQIDVQKVELATVNPRLREDSTFVDAFSYDLDELPPAKLKQAATSSYQNNLDDFDSSDDEEVKNFLERKYNEYGCDINQKLKQQTAAKHEEAVTRDVSLLATTSDNVEMPPIIKSSNWHIKNPHNQIKRHSLVSNSFKKAPPQDARNNATMQNEIKAISKDTAIYTDPVFGLRIINPLISSTMLIERMSERKNVAFSAIAYHTQRGDLSKDWVIAGVLVYKYPIKLSKNGQPYSLWRVTDLKNDIKMVSIFLFKGAHKDLWKTSTGMCLAVLNPTVFEKRAESGEVACLSIDTSQKVMILGQSKDMGVCKAKKKSGEPCTSIVNVGECDYCIYHMKQEFSKMSKRSELQSANAGRGLNELRNKVLGKSEVFYGGQSFSAVPARKSSKQTAKDANRMMSLSEYSISPNASSINHVSKQKTPATGVPYAARSGPVSKLAANVELTTKQRLKDLERLKILQTELVSAPENNECLASEYKTKPSPAEPSRSSINALERPSTTETKSTITTLSTSNKSIDTSFSSPTLSRENLNIEIHFGDRKAQLAKLNAMQLLKKKPIEKANPNSTRGTRDGKKRAIDDLNDRFDSASKRLKIEADDRDTERKTRIQRIMDATSSHTNLIHMREQQEQGKYFNKLEKKEALEEKMLNTYKIPCKAVICRQCKYTAFSAADRCKTDKHPLKVIDAEKRFFQCKDCGNRTATVFKLPKISCKNCKSSRWQRTAMIRERKICDGTEELSLRGDEETFIGSLAGKATLNLLVPDE